MKWSPNKSLIIYAILICVIAVLSPKKMNWSPSFSMQHDWPFGAKAVFERLEDIYPGDQILINERPLYNTVRDSSIENSNFLFVNNDFRLDSLDMDQLLKLAENGNTIFIASQNIDKVLLDTLDLKTRMGGDYLSMMQFTNESSELDLKLSYTDMDSLFKFRGESIVSHFVDQDSVVCNLNELGTIGGVEQNVFVERPFGNGRFYLHSMPIVFTNYHLLEGDNNNYIERALSILPYQKTYWDEYYKVGARLEGKKSMMHVFLSERSFKWVYWIGILSLLLFMLLHVKRRQRMIPVIDPPKNESVLFTKNIGELYYQNSNHTDILAKKINILKEYLSRKYFIHDIEFKEEEIQLLKQKRFMKKII